MILQGSSKRRRKLDKTFAYLTGGAAFLAALVLILLLAKLAIDGMATLNWRFITAEPSVRASKAGILSPLMGSLWIMLITAIVAVPVGVGTAIWLEEFNQRPSKLKDFLQLNISNLAGVPSIVYGILGLFLFVRTLHMDTSVLVGGLTMTLLILPVVIIVSQEALKAVPKSYREASLALGANQWQTIAKQVLPPAIPGIMTGLILSVSRAIGETAPLIVVGAAGYVSFLPKSINDHYTVLPLQIYTWSRSPSVKVYANAAGAILFLVLLLLAMNSIAIFIRSRSLKKA